MSNKQSLWPAWIPYPGCWISAMLLGLLSIGITLVMGQIFDVSAYMSNRSLKVEPLIIGTIHAILSPIPLIAIFHHYLHRVVGRWFPSIQAPEVGETTGHFPGLISWWEGFFSWAILWIASLVSLEAIIIARPIFNVSWEVLLNPTYPWLLGSRELDTIAILSWLLPAAYLYQIQYLTEQRLLRARLAEFKPVPNKKATKV